MLDILAAWWAVGAMFISGHFLPELMDSTGFKGAYINGCLLGPIVLFALWRGSIRSLTRPAVLPISILLLWTATTGIASRHWVEAGVAAFAVAITCAFAALFYERPRFLSACATAAGFFAVASAVLVVATTRNPLDLGFFLPLLATFGAAASGSMLPRRTLAMFPLVVLSTYRAATIGMAVGAAILFVRTVVGWIGVAIGCAALAMLVLPALERPVDIQPDRADVVGRFMALKEDGGSYRADLWEALIEDLSARADDADTWFGRTSGDADYYVAMVFPRIAMPGHDGPYASTHSMPLEFLFADGLIVLPLMLWAAVALIGGSRMSEPSGALVFTVGLISLTNVTIYDLAGGCAAFGLLMAVAGRRPDARSTHPA